jgi:hypothetical protein
LYRPAAIERKTTRDHFLAVLKGNNMAAVGSGAGGDLQQVWAQAVDRVKREIIAPSLWRAIERTIPVTRDGDVFAVGLAPGEGQYAGTMNTGEYRAAIERILRTVTGDNALTFRLIEGTTLEDWEYIKARDAAAVAQRQQAAQKRVVESKSFSSWDEIYDQVSRLWANAEFRALASGKGRYLEEALALINKALESLAPSEGKRTEQTERGLSRVIERVASITGSDATLIAYLLEQRRNSEGGGTAN